MHRRRVIRMEISSQKLQNIIQDERVKETFIEQLIKEYHQSITKLAYTYVKDQPLAEEVTQDVFLTCFHKIELFRNDSSIKTWLYRITINKCKDQLRKRKFIDLLMFQPDRNNQEVIETHHPESIVTANYEYKALSESVLSLPTKFKEVIYMHYYEEMKIQEISQVLSIKINTVKTRLNRGRNMLKEKYEEAIK
ncbi:sigma-70 family RNA polymerase sigma factor [Pontibacillus yanchengensis]|uniref:Sigma-70 family RNA polymerase sigma factor n=2 Tax=Pontibacillus yanchengensis TaxID=462910 RepID=A0A6I5A378_9BACI|nr:sigma-70 family RNA polymerase sigma factor [Pontibacillus yanchengensis]